jgi:outer membrane protein OmpA-like peptidoglycan-associated protein
VTYLNEHPNMKIELQGHTDAQGDAAHNLELSKNRAKAVMDYLISKGIDSNRLTYEGYGENKPAVITIDGKEVALTEDYINSLPTEKEKQAMHQLNRRTVYVVKSL